MEYSALRLGNRTYRGWKFAKLPPLDFTMFNPYVSMRTHITLCFSSGCIASIDRQGDARNERRFIGGEV